MHSTSRAATSAGSFNRLASLTSIEISDSAVIHVTA